MLIPDAPGMPTQVIDVRDLAGWLVRSCEEHLGGAYNAVGDTRPFSGHLTAARAVAGHDGPVAAAGAACLRVHGVAEWAGPKSLPLWLDDPDWQGMNARSNERAKASGLVLHPLEETLGATLGWEESVGRDRPRWAGLTREDELDLLAELVPGIQPAGRPRL